MQLTKPLVFFLFNFAVARSQECPGPEPEGCGDADACIGTETCATITQTTPSRTTITTCLPTPTCLYVYHGCEFGSPMGCCSGYCAASKCRATDEDYPDCAEDLRPCNADEDCCYKNKCVEGLCRSD